VTAPTPNAELAYAVLDQIDAHPETWNQAVYDCGTAACFAGWAVRLSGWTAGKDLDEWTVVVDGPDNLLGVHVSDAATIALRSECTFGEEDLFASYQTRSDLGRLVAEIFGPRPGGAA
jgi:hypothetical protein